LGGKWLGVLPVAVVVVMMPVVVLPMVHQVVLPVAVVVVVMPVVVLPMVHQVVLPVIQNNYQKDSQTPFCAGSTYSANSRVLRYRELLIQ
jgi:hypothetical protein